MNIATDMKRRGFLKTGVALGGGLLISFYLPELSRTKQTDPTGETFAPNAFIRIGTDDRVTIIVNKSEMGQGVYTSLPMLVAEELEVDWSRVRVESAPVDPAYNHAFFPIQMTGGSTSVNSEWGRLRMAGATARMMLIAAAAQTWNVDPRSCHAERGYVIHAASNRQLSFGALADTAAKMEPPKGVALKDPKDYKLIGRPTHRLDTPSKVDGTAQFGFDVRIPGMLTAVLARPPVFGAKAVRIKDEKAKSVPGVRAVVPVRTGVAVVATGFWPAKLGRDALHIVWDEGPNATLSTASLREQYANLAKTHGAIARKDGDPAQALQNSAKQITAEYEVPYLAHAMMEPLNCLVDLRSDHCEIWTGTQFQTVDRAAAAAVAG